MGGALRHQPLAQAAYPQDLCIGNCYNARGQLITNALLLLQRLREWKMVGNAEEIITLYPRRCLRIGNVQLMRPSRFYETSESRERERESACRA